MPTKNDKPSSHDNKKRIRVSKNGHYIVSGSSHLQIEEIRNDSVSFLSQVMKAWTLISLTK